jgi:hypothetical protein
VYASFGEPTRGPAPEFFGAGAGHPLDDAG